MKIHSIAAYVTAGFTLAVLSFGINSGQAAPPTRPQITVDSVAPPTQVRPVTWEQAKIEKLRHAYYLLEHADGDYSGHRVAAMHSIKKAAEILGVELNWKGHGEEVQWKSDRRLREARTLLSDLVTETKGKEQAHVHHAIKELDKSLAIK